MREYCNVKFNRLLSRLLFIILSFVILSSQIVLAVPGGVSDNLTLWLDAGNTSTLFSDTCGGTASTDDGDRIGCWQDSSGNSYNFNSTGNIRPSLRTDEQAINFNPSIQFDGSEDYLGDEDGENYINGIDEFSTFVVVDSDTASADKYIFNSENQATNAESPWGLRFDDVGALSGKDDTLKTGINTGTPELYEGDEDNITSADPMLISLHWESSEAPEIYVAAKNISIHPTTTKSGSLSGADYTRIGHEGGHDFWDGTIAEIVHYSARLNDTSKQKVESHLAIKYGITLHNDTDYIDSSENILWDASSHTSYNNDIAGIARDNTSFLDQNKSRSSNSDGVVIIASDTSIDDGEALIWGNNNGTNSWTTSDAPSGYRILSRKWETQETGEVGTVTISIVVNDTDYDVPSLLYGTSYYFIYDTDDDNSLDDETPILLYDDGTNGDETSSDNIWSINSTDLENNTIFSFATQITPLPGSVDDVEFWVKADVDVYHTGGTVTGWEDQIGLNNMTAQGNPQTNQTEVNFNNVVELDGDDDYFDGTTTIGMREVFMAAEALNDAPLLTSNVSVPSSTQQYWLRLISGNAYIGDSDPDYIHSDNDVPSGLIIYNHEMVGGSQGTDSRIVFNGENQSVTSISGNDPLESFSNPPKIGKSTDSGFTTEFSGSIGEIIVYNRSLNHTERTKVNSYLAIKYGITLDNSIDYLDSSGDTVYASTSSHSSYTNDVAGIGRDDGSLLNQTESKSINSESIIHIANASSLGNTEFLVWGNDNGSLTTTATNAPTGMDRITRIWRVDQTGDVGTVDLVMNISNMTLGSTDENNFLLVKNENGSNFTLVTGIPISSNDSDTLTFLNVDFSGDDYFTLAVNDTIYPNASYTTPTQSSGTSINRNYIEVNVTVVEDHLANLTYRLYNSSFDLINTTVLTSVDLVNFTNYGEGVYHYNATACDENNLCNTTETRNITIDSENPAVTNLYPASGDRFNNSVIVAINATVTDVSLDSVVANITYPNGTMTQLNLSLISGDVYGANFTIPVLAGNYTMLIIANDTLGNINDTESSSFLSELQDPNSISGIMAWYDGADNSTLYTDSSCTTQVSADNQEVLCWENKVSGGSNATVVSGKYGARYRSLSSQKISNSTTLRFNKSNETVYETGVDIRANTTEDITLFAVYRPRTNVTTDQGQGLWGNDNGAWDRFYYSLFGESVPLGTDGIDDGLISLGGASSGLSIDGGGLVDTVFLLTAIYDGNVSGATNSGPVNGSQIYFDGNLQTLFTDESHATAAQTQLYLGWDGDNGHYDGDLAEIIVYDSILTICQIELVNNYLGAKYGKDFSGIGTSYDFSAPHNNSINGVSEYTGNCSINTEVTSATSSIATIFSPNSLDFNDSLTFAHDDVGFSLSTNVSSNYTRRLSQSWRVDVDNEPGNVSLSFNIESTGIDVNSATSFVLLIDTDTDFSDANEFTTGYSVNGDVITFTDVNFSNGQYFTLGLNESPPGIVFISPTLSNLTYHPENNFIVNVSSNSTGLDHYTFVDFDNSIIFWMRMDDVNGSGDPVDIANGYNGSLTGDALINETGRFGTAVQVDGSGDYIDLPASNLLVPNEGYWAISTWFRADSVSSDAFGNRIITIRNDSGLSAISLTLGEDDNVQFFYRDQSGTGVNTNITTVSTGTWYHYVAAYDGSTFTIYINGVLNHSITDTMAQTSSHTARIGANPAGSSQFFNGSIDEVLIFNRSLSADEILSLYNASANQYENNFTSLSDRNYTFVGHAVSESGERNQTGIRTVTIDTTDPTISYITPTKLNNSVSTNSYIEINVSVSDLNLQNITFRVYNSTNDLINTTTRTDTSDTFFNITGLANGEYSYNVSACDLANNCGSVSTRNITLDNTNPAISFIDPTPSNETIQAQDNFVVNISSTSEFVDHYTFLDFNSSLVLWMRMDDVNSSGDPTDISGKDNNGSLNGSALINETGTFGNGVQLDGNGDYVEVVDDTSLNFGTGDFTYALWFNLKEIDSDEKQLLCKRVSSAGNYEAQIESNGKIRSWVGESGSSTNINSTTVVSVNTWYHLTMTRSQGTLYMYVNGVLENQTSSTHNVTSTSVLRIGQDTAGSSEDFNGSIDEVLIFNRSLSAAEILSLYNASANQYDVNFTSLNDGNHTFTGYAVAVTGNKNQTGMRNVLIDTTNPAISYTDPTRANNAYVNQNYVFVNVSVTEVNEANITFRLLNSTDLLNSTNYTTAQRTINFTGLSDGVYYYNVTVTDLADNENTTDQRTITLDTAYPAVTNLYPDSQTFNTSVVILVNATVVDTNLDTVIANITYPNTTVTQLNLSLISGNVYGANFTIPVLAGSYNLTIIANDSAGNTNDTESSIFVVNLRDPSDIANLRAWYDAADNTTLYTDESCSTPVSAEDQEIRCWEDKSSYAHNATNVSGKGLPRYSMNQFNGHSVVNFSKSETDTLRHELAASYTSDFTIFLVIQSRDSNPDTFESFFSNGEPAGTDHFQIDYTTSGDAFRYGSSTKFNFENFSNEIKLYSVTHDGTDVVLYNEGQQVNTGSTTEGRVFEHYRINQNRNGDRHHDSRIGEIILYDRVLTACELEMVNIYLGNKYGRDFFGVEDNYNHSSPYDTDVNGIGQFAGNCSATVDILSATSDLVTISEATSLELDDSLTIGHNDGGFHLITEAPTNYVRLNQTWRADEDDGGNGDGDSVGTVTVSFDISSNTSVLDYDTYTLLIDDDGNFTNATLSYNGTLSGTEINFTLVNFTHGDYFTLGFTDTIAPNVTAVNATPATTYDLSEVINISANVSDIIGVDTVLANVTLPNGTINQVTLSYDTGTTYNNTFTVPGLVGTYTVRIVANDTSGNINSSETVTFEVQNDVPDPSSVLINGGSDITLSSGTTTEIIGSATITDLNGYTHVTNATGYLFLTTVGIDASNNNSNHYTSSCTDNGDGSGSTVSYNCTFNVTHYAIPTDTGANQSATNWTFTIAPYDSEHSGTNGSDVVDLNTLTAFNISPSVVDFGSLDLGTNTTNTNQEINVTNLGNEGIDVLLSGTNLSCTTSSVSVTFLEYEDDPFDYGTGTDLSESNAEFDLDALPGTESSPTPKKTTYYGLGIPAIAVGGSCNGSIVITGQSDPNND